MLLQLKTLDIICTMPELDRIPAGKILINTINVHSYNTAQEEHCLLSLTPAVQPGRSPA